MKTLSKGIGSLYKWSHTIFNYQDSHHANMCQTPLKYCFLPKQESFEDARPTKFILCRNIIFASSLQKQAYSNTMKISPPKTEKFQIKNSDIFLISAQNIDCGYSLEPPRRGGSNEYPQSMFLSRNKKNNAYPCKPQFYYIKVGFKGVKII